MFQRTRLSLMLVVFVVTFNVRVADALTTLLPVLAVYITTRTDH